MGKDSAIEWTHHTYNPWRGCAKVSPGCTHCYAETQAKRNPRILGVWGVGGTRPRAAASYMLQPLTWNAEAQAAGERRRVFALSLGDWLEDRGDLIWPRLQLLDLIRNTEWLDWILLTKRIENFEVCVHASVSDAINRQVLPDTAAWLRAWLAGSAPKNVWLIVSVEDQPRAELRIPKLLQVPAAVRGISAEPLLGRLNLHPFLCKYANPLRPEHRVVAACQPRDDGRLLQWVIFGGESGPKARPCALEWIEEGVQQCQEMGVPVFVKQLGEYVVSEHRTCSPDLASNPSALQSHDYSALHPDEVWAWRAGLQDRKGRDITEFPRELRVREFPRTVVATASLAASRAISLF